MKANRLWPFSPIDRSLADEMHRHGASWIAGLEGPCFWTVAILLGEGSKGTTVPWSRQDLQPAENPKAVLESWMIVLVFPTLHKTCCRDAKLALSALTLQWAALRWRTAGGHDNARKRCLKSFCKPCRACLTAQLVLVRVDEGRGVSTGRGFRRGE